MKPPTFTQLRERRELRVVNPRTGVRFAVSLQDWQGSLWALRVRPEKLRPTDFDNPFNAALRSCGKVCSAGSSGRQRPLF